MSHTKSFEATRVEDFKVIPISSPVIINGSIPSRYTCDGLNINPPLDLQDIPEETKSLAIMVEDPDAPKGTFVHWMIWNIPVTHHIKEGHKTGVQGVNDFGSHNYGGPCPPLGVHHYQFKVYALDNVIDISVNSNKEELEKAMADHILGFGLLEAKYARK